MLENVEEFADWGPLTPVVDPATGKAQFDADGNPKLVPCKDRKGKTFEHWKTALERQGYQVEYRMLRACDYGAPTIRKRLFLVARCDGRPIVWPKPTHGAPDDPLVKCGKLQPWKTTASIIDWSQPCHSIFLNSEEAKSVGVRRPLAENTMKRIARGVQRFVIEAEKPFIVEPSFITEHANASHQRNMATDEPLRTICAEVKGGHFALVSPTLIQTGYGERPGQEPRAPGLHKPLGTIVAGGGKHALVSAFLAKHFGGNYNGPGVRLSDPASTVTTVDHHSLVACNMVRQFGRSVGHDMDDPTGTVTAGGGGKSALITSHLVKYRGSCADGQQVNEPAPTITAQGQHIAEVRAFLIKYYGPNIGFMPDDPMHTATTKARFGLVTVAGEDYQITDIGMRMLTPRELYRAQGFPEDYQINIEIDGKRLSKASQIRMCGNSVSPHPARALIEANVTTTAKRSQAA